MTLFSWDINEPRYWWNYNAVDGSYESFTFGTGSLQEGVPPTYTGTLAPAYCLYVHCPLSLWATGAWLHTPTNPIISVLFFTLQIYLLFTWVLYHRITASLCCWAKHFSVWQWMSRTMDNYCTKKYWKFKTKPSVSISRLYLLTVQWEVTRPDEKVQ